MGLEWPAAQKQTPNSVFEQWSLRTTNNKQTQMHWCIWKLERSLKGNDNKLQTDLKQSRDCYYGIFNVYTETYLSLKWKCITHPFTNSVTLQRRISTASLRGFLCFGCKACRCFSLGITFKRSKLSNHLPCIALFSMAHTLHCCLA